MKTTAKKHLIFSLFIGLFVFPLISEPFRVAKLHIINLQQDSSFEKTEELGLNDAMAIYLPEDKSFIEGIEIKMSIPEQIAQWRDCCACYIYEKINPMPSKDQIDFSGNKVFFGVLPGKLSWILQIPFKKDNNLKTNQYTTKLEDLPDISNNFIFLRLQQIMKGIPDNVMNSEITITVRPILSDKGKLNLKINSSNSDNLTNTDFSTVFIDDVLITDKLDSIFLDTGIHNISIISENYRTEVRTVRIDQAKTTLLEIDLKSIEPTIIITAPAGTEAYLDDEICTEINKELPITEGEHKVRFVIGDYEIIRSISVIKGKTYKVNLAVDLQISEE